MKGKILYLIIGILIGAIITSSGFLIYNKFFAKNVGRQMHQIERNDGDMTEPHTRPDRKSSEELPEI